MILHVGFAMIDDDVGLAQEAFPELPATDGRGASELPPWEARRRGAAAAQVEQDFPSLAARSGSGDVQASAHGQQQQQQPANFRSRAAGQQQQQRQQQVWPELTAMTSCHRWPAPVKYRCHCAGASMTYRAICHLGT